MNTNTISKGSYILMHLIWGVVATIWYVNLLFCNVRDLGYSSSKALFAADLIILSAVGIIITWNRRSRGNIFLNVAIPFEVYAAVSYAGVLSSVRTALITSAVLSGVYVLLVMARRIRNRTKKRAIINKRLKNAFFGTRAIVGCCLFIMIINIGINSLFGGVMAPSAAAVRKSGAGEDFTIENNLDILSRFDESIWSGLSAEDKLDALQVAANIEVVRLALPHELNVRLEARLSEHTVASYNDNTHIISINVNSFNSKAARELLDAVAHEAYHAYERRLIDLYDSTDDNYKDLPIFGKVKRYKDEFSHYIDGEKDIYGYFFQICEVNARNYAKESVEIYYDKINAYLYPEMQSSDVR